jgi:YEATS domain-containing protein 4
MESLTQDYYIDATTAPSSSSLPSATTSSSSSSSSLTSSSLTSSSLPPSVPLPAPSSALPPSINLIEALPAPPSDYDPNPKRLRLDAVSVACPFVYGSLAVPLPKKSLDSQATHKWTLFVRGPNDEDMSCFISKVAFSLHQSFAEPVRVVTSPPFEVSASGWGEFEAGIRIFFKDPTEQPIDLQHVIKLYHPENTDRAILKKPVMKECYDEIVCTKPNPHFKRMLLLYKKPEQTMVSLCL